MSSGRVLIVDDEPTSRITVRDFLQMRGFEVLEAQNCAVARELQVGERPEAAVVDYALPDGNAFDLLKVFRESDPGLAVVILTGYGTIESAVDAMRFGAVDYVQKPFTEDELVEFANRLVLRRQDRRERAYGVVLDAVDERLARGCDNSFPVGTHLSGHGESATDS